MPTGTPISSYAQAGSSPTGTDTSTPAAKTTRIAIWGAGGHGPWQSNDPYQDGARWYREEILDKLANQTSFTIGEDAFNQNDGSGAIRKILQEVDQNGDHIISSSEASNAKLKICGYSWGAITALGLAQKLNQTGYIRVGGSPSQPIQYRLDSTIPVYKLVLMDPIPIVNWPTGSLPANVQNFWNYYQTRGDNSQFYTPGGTPGGTDTTSQHYNWGNFGFPFTRKWKGIPIPNHPGSTQTNVTTDCVNHYRDWPCPNLGGTTLRLDGQKVNHTTIPLFVSQLVLDLMTE